MVFMRNICMALMRGKPHEIIGICGKGQNSPQRPSRGFEARGAGPHRQEHHTQEQRFDDTTRDLDMYGASAFRDMAAAHFGGYPYLRGPLRNQPPSGKGLGSTSSCERSLGRFLHDIEIATE